MNPQKEQLILDLHRIEAIQFGEFKLKSGLISPFYIDLRGIVSHPDIMQLIVDLLAVEIERMTFDVMTGIPYTALPIASILSVKTNKPLIYARKEAKSYGTKKLIEGHYETGNRCLVIDDLISTGESKFETAESLENEGLQITDFIVVVDRSPNGKAMMDERGYQLTALITIDEILTTLHQKQLITSEQQTAVKRFIQSTITPEELSLSQRADLSINPLTRKLIALIEKKQTNLICSLDVEHAADFFRILDQVADEIVMLKTHVDILQDFSPDFVKKLRDYAGEREFFIFEDRKFADIGSTVRKQFRSGMYQISDWAEFVTVHAIAGEAILDGLFGDREQERSGFLLAKMSAAGNLISENYTRQVLDIGKKRRDIVSGFIGFGENEDEIRKLKNKMPPDLLFLMPGVNLEVKGDQLGQRYVSVSEAIRGGVDCIIVGRGIYQSDNPQRMAKLYRETAMCS